MTTSSLHRRTGSALVAGLAAATLCALAAPQPAQADLAVAVSAELEAPRLPLWALDLTTLPLLPAVQSVLDGLTYSVCTARPDEARPRCSLPTPIGLPVAVDLDQAKRPGLLGLVTAPDFDARLSLVPGSAASASGLLGLGDPGAVFDGVALRFDLSRSLLDGLDGTRAGAGRVYALLHIPAVGYDAQLGFDSPVGLADRALVTLGVDGDDLVAAAGGVFEAGFVIEHTRAQQHAVLVGLAPVTRQGLAGRQAEDPLGLSLRFDRTPSRMTGTLHAEQSASYEALGVRYDLPPGERPALELVARQDFTRQPRLQPDVQTRHLRAALTRMPGHARVDVIHRRNEAGRELLSLGVDTDEPTPRLDFSEVLVAADGGLDALELTALDLPALNCGVADAPCAHIDALLPRDLASLRFDPQISADLGVNPVATQVSVRLASQPAGVAPGILEADLSHLPTRFALDAAVDLATQTGTVNWQADAPGAAVNRLALDTRALRAGLSVFDLPAALELRVQPDAVNLWGSGPVGRVRGWLATGDEVAPAPSCYAHVIGRLVAQTPATPGGPVPPAVVALSLDLGGVQALDLQARQVPSEVVGVTEPQPDLALDLSVPGGQPGPIDLDLDLSVDALGLRAQGVLYRLPEATTLDLNPQRLSVEVTEGVAAYLQVGIGAAPLAPIQQLPLQIAPAVAAEISPSGLRAGLEVTALPRLLRVNLAAVGALRSIAAPADLFATALDGAYDDAVPLWRAATTATDPLLELGDLPAFPDLKVNVAAVDATGKPDLIVEALLEVSAGVSHLAVGPLAMAARDQETRALEARVTYEGGRVDVGLLRLGVRRAEADGGQFEVVRASVHPLPHRFALLTAVGGSEIALPGQSLAFDGLALLVDHDGNEPALQVWYRDENLPAPGGSLGGWHLQADLRRLPRHVWLVASGGRLPPGGLGGTDSCVSLFFPTPALEYVASADTLGLNLALAGVLVSPNLGASYIAANIGKLPERTSISALNDGARVLRIAGANRLGEGRFIEQIALTIDAQLTLAMNCAGEASGGGFMVGGYLRLDGPDNTATAGTGPIHIRAGGIRFLEVDFADPGSLFGLADTSIDFEGFAFDLSEVTPALDLALSLGADASYHFDTPFGDGDLGIHPRASVDIDISLGLEPLYFGPGQTELASVTVAEFPCDQSCDVSLRMNSGIVPAAQADLTLYVPRGLPGQTLLRVVGAALRLLRDGRSPADLFSVDIDCPDSLADIDPSDCL